MYTKEQNEEIRRLFLRRTEKIKEELKPYMNQLPEYTHLVTELFRE